MKVRLVQRALASTAIGPMKPLWRGTYRLIGRVTGRWLSRSVPVTSVYARFSTGQEDLVPGYSDIDYLMVTRSDEDRGRAASLVHARRARLAGRSRAAVSLIDRPRVLSAHDAQAVGEDSLYTFGLAASSDLVDRALFTGEPEVVIDAVRTFERPYANRLAMAGVCVRGTPIPPPSADLSDQALRVAAWLELLFYWKRGLAALADPRPPHTPLLCVKLVTDPLRMLRLLNGDEIPRSRGEALEVAYHLLPNHRDDLAQVCEVWRRRSRPPAAPVESALACLIVLTRLTGAVIERQLADVKRTAVELRGVETSRHNPSVVPLCDWSALADPGDTTGTFELLRGAATPAMLRTLSQSNEEAITAGLHDSGLLFFPSADRTLCARRAAATSITDPVTAALTRGESNAQFVAADGWSIEHWARRAVAEHRASRRSRGDALGEQALLRAARAEILRQSLLEGSPVLCLTTDAVRAQLAESGVVRLGATETETRDALTSWLDRAESPRPAVV